jgi:ribosomal protein S18 acetylase RimI-like enzyme
MRGSSWPSSGMEQWSEMLIVQPLKPSHRRDAFTCGNDDLDNWLKQIASKHQRRGISKTRILAEDRDPDGVLGFYSLSACHLVASELSTASKVKLPRQVPAVRMGRLAISSQRQRQGLGGILIADALQRSAQVAANVGVHGLVVDAKDDAAAAYYTKFGFLPFPSKPLTLILVLP